MVLDDRLDLEIGGTFAQIAAAGMEPGVLELAVHNQVGLIDHRGQRLALHGAEGAAAGRGDKDGTREKHGK